MQEYRIAYTNYAKDIRGTYTLHAASLKNALRMLARKMHRGAPLTFKPNGVASTSQLVLTLES